MTIPVTERSASRAQPSYKERSIWRDVPNEEWRDWHWQMRHRITTAEELARILPMTPREQRTIERALDRFRFAVPPYYASLIDPDDPECPIRLQAIPGEGELTLSDFDIEDPLNEEGDSVAPGMTHRYPDRVLWVVVHECAMLCRHCTRKRKVGERPAAITDAQLDAGIAYLNEHTEIRDVLLSGGDPLLLSDERLEHILKRLRAEAPSVEIIRIGSRLPVTMPQRITPNLAATLKRYHPIYLNTHFNVPKEFTSESEAAVALLADAGIPLGNQTVLLRSVNDCWALMRKLMHKLTVNRIRPYYIYQCDLAEGLMHFRTTVAKGIEIMEHLRGHISGLAVPTFVVDAPGGGGKIPVHPNYVVSQHEHKVILRNFEGRIVAYEEPRDYIGMCSEGHPCSHCREVLREGLETVGVAGLFDDDPGNIALIPSALSPEEEGEEEEPTGRSA
ncbi:MAG: lysine 2,3-aminomutase [Acidobacteria bacterium]|jgi:lysine 2,3-aminomutase|nr:lysine 2,3-aminomutase [Acidobacteriota bacterium]